jgi:RND family efflux transporter MFP subunit
MLNYGKRKHNSMLGVIPAAVGVLAALGIGGCKEQPAVVAKPTPVRVTTVVFEPDAEARRYVGVIRPRFESDLGFRVAGKISERLADVGATVKAGDVIARLDPTDFRLTQRSQDAELSAARSNRDQAVTAEDRYRTLLAKGHVSQAALDQRKAAGDEARSRFERAERALELATNQIAYTELKADHSGVVSLLPVEAGQVVAAGQTVARIARQGEREAVVAIPEQRLGELQSSDATVELWAGGKGELKAKLREVSPEADKATRTFQARFSIDQLPASAGLGMTATVALRPARGAEIARLPLSAVMNDGKGAAVFVVDASGTRVERRAVVVAAFGQDAAAIQSGLKSGERVVTLGVHAIDPGQPVRIVETRAETDRPAAVR